MPKPVLSDSLFNADDVATAILSEANLQVANSDLGVTDITSSFTRDSNWTGHLGNDHVFKFMGFVFYNLSAYRPTGVSSGQTVFNIDTQYRPSDTYNTNSIAYQGEFAHYIAINSNGTITIDNPDQPSGADVGFRVIINGWYRLT